MSADAARPSAGSKVARAPAGPAGAGGITVVAARDMSLLLESQIGEFASTATTRVSRKGRLWASSTNCVRAEQWGHSSYCFYRPGRRSAAWQKIKPRLKARSSATGQVASY